MGPELKLIFFLIFVEIIDELRKREYFYACTIVSVLNTSRIGKTILTNKEFLFWEHLIRDLGLHWINTCIFIACPLSLYCCSQ